MVVTDRLSVFDVVLPRPIPYKGQVLCGIARLAMQQTEALVPHWVSDVPHPQVMIGRHCQPYKVEVIVRAYLAGHAWRLYRSGARSICGVPLPEGLAENDRLPHPIITPSTKADEGSHDADISERELLRRGLVSEKDWAVVVDYARKNFARGTEVAASRGLLLVDTKYEFGRTASGEILLIDEMHTPDSSRYFYAQGYRERQERGQAQKQLSKEFAREWCMSQGFHGSEGQAIPLMSEAVTQAVSERYLELYERMVGSKLLPQSNTPEIIEAAVRTCIAGLSSSQRVPH